jgi:hypothetical protein
MLRLLVAAAALCTVINADETVTLKRDAPADEPEVQASMNSLGGAFMPAVGEDYENEAAKEAERVRLSQAAEQAEARARAEHAQRLEEAQRAYAAQQQAAQTAALERAKAEALAQAEAQAAAKAEADAAAAQEDASPETATHTPMHAEAAELAQAYAAAAETLSGISGEEEAAPEADADAEEAAEAKLAHETANLGGSPDIDAGEATSEEQATPEEQAAAAEALRAENAARLREAVAQQQRQLREAELARRAEQQATLAEAQQQAGVTTDALREHTMPIKQEPRSPLESDLRPADADQLKDIYQRDQKLAEMRSRAQVDPSTELRRAQAWAELPARERRSCAAEVSRITKNYKRGHYAVLGLRRSASQMEIRQRYRQKALLVHPEKNPSPDARLAFEQLREAGETLADDRLRDAYDRKLQRQQEVQVDQFRREVLAFAETSAEYLQARLREFPRVLYGAAAVSFLLV